MPLFRRKDEYVRAERWSDPAQIPPAPRELLRLSHSNTWLLQPYLGKTTLASNVKPVPSWIVEFPDGTHMSMSDKEFLNEFEEVTDEKHAVHHAWAMLASEMLDALKPLFGHVANMDGPARVRLLVDRMVASETKARMWDRLPGAAKRRGIDVNELIDAIKKELT